MEASVKKWGNSAAVRIPAGVLADAKIKLDQPVRVREERGRIVIEPLRQQTLSIRKLVKAICPGNLHDAIDTGPAMGREVW